MSVSNLLKYGAIGLAADLFAPMITGGMATPLAALYGLFQPDANAMDRAYAPQRFGASAPPKTWTAAKVGAVLFGSTTLLPTLLAAASTMPCYGSPMYFPSIWSTPWSPAGLIPMAWRSGLIRNWGWCAGTIL